MAGVDALGGAVTWAELGSISVAIGALATALYSLARMRAKTEENSKQIEVLMTQMQTKVNRDDFKDVTADLRGYIKDVRADLKDAIGQISTQISNLSNQMQKSRSHSGG